MVAKETLRLRNNVMNKSVQFGLPGLNGQNVPRLVMVALREETGSVSCPRRRLDYSVQERTMKRGTATSTNVQFGQTGLSGHLAPRHVEADKGHL